MNSEAKLFKALADETRLRILALLQEGELCVCELIAALGLPQSTVSRHLAYLRNAGWVSDRRQGIWMYYRFNPNAPVLVATLRPLLKAQLEGNETHRKALVRLEAFRRDQARQAC